VLIWATLIFAGSGDLLSEGRTSRFIGPILRWFKPDLSDATVRTLQSIIRKGGHVTEYAILALLTLRALTRTSRLLPSTWSWRPVSLTLGLCALYAISDEFHQSFVSSRYGSPLDVLIDTVGAALGLGVVWLGVKQHRQAATPDLARRVASVEAATR
jgi:VanZ family protein